MLIYLPPTPHPVAILSGNHQFVFFVHFYFAIISFVSLFQISHINSIILYLSFFVQLISLNMIISRSIHVSLFHFLWMGNILLYIYIHTPTYIYIISSLSIWLFMDIQAASMSWLLYIVLM